MNMATLGAVLRDLIKERGFTQEEFADNTGIGLSSLKKYISGQVFYTIDILELFAEQLQCSYDYLLGKSLTPNRELQDLKEATRLQDGAIERLLNYAKHYDDDRESKRYLETLSTLIQSNFLLERIIDYFYIDEKEEYIISSSDFSAQTSVYIGDRPLTVPDIEDAYLLGIMRALVESKNTIGENVPLKLRNYKTKKRKE